MDKPDAQIGKLVEKLFNDNWPKRRRLLYLTLVFDAIAVGWILFFNRDTQVSSQLGTMLIAQATALLTAYIFGAVWDDHNKRIRLRVPGAERDRMDEDYEYRRDEDEDERPSSDHEPTILK